MRTIERTARHEAGHVVMALLLGEPVERVWIDQDGNGSCVLGRPVFDRDQLLILAAGPAAESFVDGVCANNDWDVMRVILQKHPNMNQDVLWWHHEAHTELDGWWNVIEAIADELVAKRELFESEILELWNRRLEMA